MTDINQPRALPALVLALTLVAATCVGCAPNQPADETAYTETAPPSSRTAQSDVPSAAPTPVAAAPTQAPSKMPAQPPLPSPSPAQASAEPIWAVRFADWVMSEWPDPNDIVGAGWEYNSGIILYGIAQTYRLTGDAAYRDYVQTWVDRYVDAQGNLEMASTHNLDLIQPATVLLFLYEETGDPRYHQAATQARDALAAYPRNAEGGFWHKDRYPNEMWVDGIYMAEPFLVGYGHSFGDDGFCLETAIYQTTLIAEHAQDPRTGLLRHGWDCDRNAAWAAADTGLSPEVWSRGLGWYTMALVDMLERLPEGHDGREALLSILQPLATGIADTQDPATGLWYQVLDKPREPDNWLETSGSAMFVYALAKAARLGYLDESYLAIAESGWRGVQTRLSTDDEGQPVVAGAVEGMGVQASYADYVSRARLSNSPHGLMAAMLASTQME